MASGSSRRASHSGIANPVKESHSTPEVKKGVINTTDNLSSSHLLSELELLDKSIGELRSCKGGESESKLKSLERHIQEVHKCVGEELAKLHLAQKDQQHPPQPSSVPPLPATQTPQIHQQAPQQPVQQWPAQTGPIVSKELFFCKLITNSLHALENVQADDHKGNRELKIRVDLNKTHKTMSIIDNGIGMTKADLEMDLSTHGVLCSAFVAADKIVVTTKRNENEQCVCEASQGDHCFKIDRDDIETSSGRRGTRITLFLKDDHLEYLEQRRLQGLVIEHIKYIDYRIDIRNYDSSNKYQGGIVHYRGSSVWLEVTPIVSMLESCLLESFPANEVDALKKKIEKKKKKKGSKEEVSFEEKKKELESLRKVMAKVVGKQVEKVVVSEGCVFPKMACTFSVDPKSKAITMELNPWEPKGILVWLAELVAEDSVKYRKVLNKMISLLVAMAAAVSK